MSTKKEDEILAIVKKILALLGFAATAKLNFGQEQISIEIETQPAGLLIGRQGQNLKALERILQVISYQISADSKMVTVDVAGFRKKRMEELETRVARIVEEVLHSKQPQRLEGLTAAERKTVHLTIAKTPGLTSESQGVGANRVLTISTRK